MGATAPGSLPRTPKQDSRTLWFGSFTRPITSISRKTLRQMGLLPGPFSTLLPTPLDYLEEWPDLTNKRPRKVYLINFITNTTIAVPFSTNHAESAIKSRGFRHCESDQSNRWKIPFPFSLLLLCDGCWATLMTSKNDSSRYVMFHREVWPRPNTRIHHGKTQEMTTTLPLP